MSRGLAILTGIVEGINESAKNLYNLRIAKEKLQQERETFTLDKKIKEIQLKKYELDPNFDPEIHAQQKDLLSKQYKQANAMYDLQSAIQAAAQKGETAKLTELQKQAQAMNNVFTGIKIGASGLITTTEPDLKKDLENKILGGTATKEEEQRYESFKTTGKPTLWDLQKEARTTVNSMLQNNPELQGKVFENPNMLTGLIDQEVTRLQGKYMGSAEVNKQSPGAQEEKVQLPPEIKTTTQAVDYLMKNQNMTKEQAIEWIKGQ
jgi:hypothetical protein